MSVLSRGVLAVTGVLTLTTVAVLALAAVAASTTTATAAAGAAGCPVTGAGAGAAALRAARPSAVTAPGSACPPAGRGAAGQGAAGAGFDPGNIASDAVFYDATAMNQQQIAAFIDERGADCTEAWCLRSLRVDAPAHPADEYCLAWPGGAGLSAAQVIGQVALACGINPQVLLVTLQKESQGLTRTDAGPGSWAAAWGWHCPDTGPGGTANCDPAHAGFVNQAYGMAHQWAKYRAEIPRGRYTYQPGGTYDILWNVAESGCGAAPVTIANLATASLYTYTPYQPNAASLAAYPGEGDACSSYGNRNFFRLFQDYFGSTGGGTTPTEPTQPGITGGPGAAVAASGSTVVLPAGEHTVWKGRDYAGTVITAPTPGVAAGIAAGLEYLGMQYAWGGGNAAGPSQGVRDGGAGDAHGDYNRVGFDCSGLTSYVAAHYPALIPRHSSYQRSDAPEQVPWEQALPGDLVGYPGHVAVYLGTVDGQRLQLEAPYSGQYVRVSAVADHADPVLHRWWTP